MAKTKAKAKSKPKGKLLGKTKVRTIAHLRFNAEGKPRKSGF